MTDEWFRGAFAGAIFMWIACNAVLVSYLAIVQYIKSTEETNERK